MKKIPYSVTAAIAISGVVLMQGVLPAFASNSADGQKLVNQVTRYQNQASKSAARQQDQLQTIISRSNSLISTRLTSLNTLSTRVQNDTRLSASEKSTLTSDIQTDISGLTALKTKIDADTDATTARSDEKTIITSYYVFATFEPKMRYLIILNNMQTVASNIQALVPQLQNLINTFKSQGKDVTQLQSLLDDISSQLTTINSTLSADVTTVENISTTTPPATGTFSKIKTDISQIVKADLSKIQSDFQQMRPLFKQIILQKAGTTPTPSQAAATSTTPAATTTVPSPSASVSPATSTTP